ncbi:deoxyribodipyrimidine photo-lyase [uncultured Cetobacterium sp.]|uniref:deoxyribodipyrimidine photo-lyase n=1 Tax=uncultured Cetobacterium sp. TaxID=527638 RepID=UPI0025F7B716|nr:deoxyribodipyrimidine photo-lyase [uncultured Cetobacterium sp.]
MDKERVKYLKINKEKKGEYIIYWMQETQRIEYNFSLEKAIEVANESKLPLYVIFNYIKNYPEASERHFKFMLQGLKDVRDTLERYGIQFVLLEGDLEKNMLKISKDARTLIWDKSYLRYQRDIREKILKKLDLTIIEVENNVVVPVEVVSFKEEYSAKTFRDKYKKVKERYLKESDYKIVIKFAYNELINNKLKKMDQSQIYLPQNKARLDGDFIGGEIEAKKVLEKFIEEKLEFYSLKGPDNDWSSKLSPYLHFGQISPLQIWSALKKIKELEIQKDKFLEELFIRRELAINFVYYNLKYDAWDGITYKWAYETMEKHLKDQRDYLYSLEELENYKTHDIYWNSAQKQMVDTGYMESYMRMYWCKKLLEWVGSPQEAYEIAINLNNKYLYDGRDPNSYAGVAWCFGKHDRAWKERKIFGKVRYMNSSGLEKKFDMEKYIKKIVK